MRIGNNWIPWVYRKYQQIMEVKDISPLSNKFCDLRSG